MALQNANALLYQQHTLVLTVRITMYTLNCKSSASVTLDNRTYTIGYIFIYWPS